MALIEYKPAKRSFFLDYLIPLQGAVSFAAIYTRTMFPEALEALVEEDYAEYYAGSFFLCTILGIYRRPFLSGVPGLRRCFYAMTATTMYSLTNVAAWMLARRYIPLDDNAKLLMLTLSSSLLITKFGREYLGHMDKFVQKRIKETGAGTYDQVDDSDYEDSDQDSDDVDDNEVDGIGSCGYNSEAMNSDYSSDYSTDDLS